MYTIIIMIQELIKQELNQYPSYPDPQARSITYDVCTCLLPYICYSWNNGLISENCNNQSYRTFHPKCTKIIRDCWKKLLEKLDTLLIISNILVKFNTDLRSIRSFSFPSGVRISGVSIMCTVIRLVWNMAMLTMLRRAIRSKHSTSYIPYFGWIYTIHQWTGVLSSPTIIFRLKLQT